MASDGDTITYTFDNGNRVSEDISDIDSAVVEYCDAGGGASADASGGNGGRVENAEIDVSQQDVLYIWVGGVVTGRYLGQYGAQGSGAGSGSSEIAFDSSEPQTASDDFAFLVGSGGGAGGAYYDSFYDDTFSGGDGARTSSGPPDGGLGVSDTSTAGGDGQGAIDDNNRGLVSGGTTIEGGGSSADVDGEIQISYVSTGPSAPTNVQITDSSVEDELTIDWDEDSNANGYYIYRAEASGSTTGDYTEIADVTSPPYTDANVEDGEQYYYRVASHL